MTAKRLVKNDSTLLLAAALTAVSAAVAEDRYTPVVQSVPSPPRRFTDSHGRTHLVYELQLINGFPMPVTVTSVEIQEARRRRPLDRLQGSELTASMSLLSLPTVPATMLPASGVGVVWLDIVVPSGPLPAAVRHLVTVAVPPGLPVPSTVSAIGGPVRVDRRPPLTLGPPLAGPGWVAVGSCCDGPHRRSVQPVNGRLRLGQRFAIDWNGLDESDRFVTGDPDANTSWVFYGKPVIAVANGRVVRAVDRHPDQVPNHPNPVTLPNADGNYVILALGDGRYALYAHLQPGSVRVRAGQRVRRGQVIAALGNSGSSSGPHLHFQVMDSPSALAADGLPYVFDRFRTAGRLPPLDDALFKTINAGQPVSIDRTDVGERRKALPEGGEVVDFPVSRGKGRR